MTHATRRNWSQTLNGGWLSGGGEVATNETPLLEVETNGATSRLLAIDARWGRGSMSSDLDQMARRLISTAAQSSSPLAAACRPAASLAWIPPLYLHLMEMRACGSGSRALWALVPIGRLPLAQWRRTCEGAAVCTLSVERVREY